MMRPDVLGSIMVTGVSTLVVLATYRPEKNEKRLKKFFVVGLAALFAFGLSFLVLFLFFAYSAYGAQMNVIRSEPDF